MSRQSTPVSGVELSDVSIRYNNITAVDGISLSVQSGEFFTLVGPSGCGKTTTLRGIAGFEPPTTGSIHIDGAEMASIPPEDRDIGIVFQNYALFPNMTLRENVGYGLRYQEPPNNQSRADRVTELLSLVDMESMGNRSPTELSGGQQQRIALARALAPSPSVLLLDEPLSALDAQLRERLRLTVRNIQQELGITTVYVTHDQSEALAISDRVAVMNNGSIEQVAPPEQIYRAPASEFVATFVGDNNIFHPTVTDTAPLKAQLHGETIRLPESTDATIGDSITIVIRPEAFSIEEGANSVTLSVEQAEFLGDAYRLHCQWESQTVVVKTIAETPPSGEISVNIHTERIHQI